jgi:hypothetical protein
MLHNVYAWSPFRLPFTSFFSFRAFGLNNVLILRAPPKCTHVPKNTIAKLKQMKIHMMPKSRLCTR